MTATATAAESSPESGRRLPLSTRFTLGAEITPQQWAFLDEHGFLVFDRVASAAECDELIAEADRVAAAWLAEGRTSVYGIPLFIGRGIGGAPHIARLPFTSMFSDAIHSFVREPRFRPILDLVGRDTRIGDREKDGVVINRYLNVPGSAYPRLGWHTDGLRDIAYLRMPKRMLNVGMHFDHVAAADGGLRILPGTHNQSFRDMCSHKLYFLDHCADPREVAVETRPGDVTVHDGRTWHRVQRSPHTGTRSLRRSMYLPYLTDVYQPMGEHSKTPIYHRIGSAIRKLRGSV